MYVTVCSNYMCVFSIIYGLYPIDFRLEFLINL